MFISTLKRGFKVTSEAVRISVLMYLQVVSNDAGSQLTH